ncbi:MAG: 4'-phosphopantetheinyl transferase superfamily protein [Chitinophagaceae bacterium]|nr:4'-phosphopantetheinyl transferase superfamily protein [Chitinophagaceae bacterium]
MVHVFYTTFTNKLPADKYQQLLAQLPPIMQQQVSGFRKWEDAHRSVLGKALLIEGLKEYNLGSVSLADLNYTVFLKPFFINGIHFNISHSGNCIVCAIGTTEVGVDVEEIKEIPLSDFKELFSPEELKLIFEDPYDYAPFYTLWTQKEAFLKAVGVGLNMPLNKVIIRNNTIEYNGNTWYLKQLSIQERYICHVASPILNVQVNLKELHF